MVRGDGESASEIERARGREREREREEGSRVEEEGTRERFGEVEFPRSGGLDQSRASILFI